jgi:hypothetical protein
VGFEGSVATRARPDDVNVVAACGICRPDLHGYADPGVTDLILRPAEPISGIEPRGQSAGSAPHRGGRSLTFAPPSIRCCFHEQEEAASGREANVTRLPLPAESDHEYTCFRSSTGMRHRRMLRLRCAVCRAGRQWTPPASAEGAAASVSPLARSGTHCARRRASRCSPQHGYVPTCTVAVCPQGWS